MQNKEYWRKQIPHPYSPNYQDLEIYLKYKVSGKTLLLGCTHDLIEHSDFQMDFDPWYESDTVITMDWRDNKTHFANMMGDGVLNLKKELTDDVLKMAQKHSKRLIVRSFNYKLPIMKIADYFPNKNEFSLRPTHAIEFAEYSFYIWNFSND